VTFFQKDVENPFTEVLPEPILLFWSRRKSPTRQFFGFTNHLEKMFHEGVDGNEKRYRMGGSLGRNVLTQKAKCFGGANKIFDSVRR
jgi:hypothetical protein